MKLLHLSDLHLGKRWEERSLIEDQEEILFHRILPIVDAERPDAVLLAGDIYDKSMPSAEAVTLFDQFLYELVKRDLSVFIISGNHDGPERLAFGGRILKAKKIYLSPVYSDGVLHPITMSDADGPVHFWLLPFLKPANVRQAFPDETIESYTDAIRLALRGAVEQIHADPTARHVLLAHQFVTGASLCDSEEVSVGGSDNVDASVFEEFDYVALGHLHGPQNIGSNRIRYCGTPLKYSFSEAGQEKSVTIVILGPKGERELRTIPLIPRHDVREIAGSFEELTSSAYVARTKTDDYLHITLTDEEDIPEAIGRLRLIYPNILHLSYDNTRTRTNRVLQEAENIRRKSPLELFAELYETQNNQPMSEEQQRFVTDLLESIQEGNA